MKQEINITSEELFALWYYLKLSPVHERELRSLYEKIDDLCIISHTAKLSISDD